MLHKYSNMTTQFQLAPRMESLPPNYFFELRQLLAEVAASGVEILRLDIGAPDMPPANFIIESMSGAADDATVHSYSPINGAPEYRQAWATYYQNRFGVTLDPATEVFSLLGSKEGIFNLAQVYVGAGDVVLVPDPGYITYTSGTLMAGGVVVRMPLLAENKFLPDFDAISADDYARAKIMWLNYPNNPTGATAGLDFFKRAVELAHQHNFILAHDAPYADITFGDYRAPSVLEIDGAKEVAVEFNSMSKTYNMAGWRTAAAVGNAEVLRNLGRWKSNVDTGSFRPLMTGAATALTGSQEWLMARNDEYQLRRDMIMETIAAIGWEANVPEGGMYVWARVPGVENTATFVQQLLRETGVSLTPGAAFGTTSPDYLRFSLGTPTKKVRAATQRLRDWSA